MRAFLVVLCLVILASTATARPAPELPIRSHVSYALPSDDCGDCVGASASAGTYVPGCYDCDGVGAGASLENDDDGTTAVLRVCKTGFVYLCVVDEDVTV